MIRILDIPTIAITDRILHQMTEKKDVVPSRKKESMPLRVQSSHTIDKRSTMFPNCKSHFKTTGYAFATFILT
jgi:hypothetical protein